MVGDPTGTSGFEPLDNLEGVLPRTATLLGVLNTDVTAGNRIADAIGTVVSNYKQGFADRAAGDPEWAGNDANLLRAARLLGVASSTDLRRSDGGTFQPGDVVAGLRFRVAAN